MTKKYPLGLTILLFVALFINACASVSSVAKKITVESGEIAPDMAKEKFTIIGVLHGRQSYDKYVDKAFADYSGQYVLASREEIAKKYTDSIHYRYIMDYDFGKDRISSYNTTSGRMENNTVGHYNYYILDRQTGKKYKRRMGSSSFSLEMQAYVKAIDAARKK